MHLCFVYIIVHRVDIAKIAVFEVIIIEKEVPYSVTLFIGKYNILLQSKD